MTIKIEELVEATKKEIENKKHYIQALEELKVINGLTHRQFEKVNKILKDNNLETKYSFVYNKVKPYSKGSAFIHDLTNDAQYFYETPSGYHEIRITDEIIKKESEELKILIEAHNYALEKDTEIKKQLRIMEDSKKKIIEAITYNSNIANEFHKKFSSQKASSIYVSVNSSISISIY